MPHLLASFAAFLTAYYAAADDLFFNVPTVVDNQVVQRQAFRNTETLGLEAEFNLQVTEGWRVGLSATYQDPEFVNTPAAEFINSDGNVDTVNINGNMPVRVPKHFGQLTTSYEFEDFAWGVASVNATYSWSGKRYADDAKKLTHPLAHKIVEGIEELYTGKLALLMQYLIMRHFKGVT